MKTQKAKEVDKTKLLKMVEDALQTAPPDEEAEARAVIYAVAEWFDEVLQHMGITPSSIPALLRWQANQHEYLSDD
jgi:predicted Zn-dependent protease with MMP-like domain